MENQIEDLEWGSENEKLMDTDILWVPTKWELLHTWILYQENTSMYTIPTKSWIQNGRAKQLYQEKNI